ncbi:DUF924 family protein [Undibacterium sp.]|uniref:DUF924 family protein n=1 Tax=Undibacterium sp. TaxID=1914977 RepID=UPI00374D483E
METIDSIVDFWFGIDPDDEAAAKKQSQMWWQKQPETDTLIRQRFMVYTQEASTGILEPWSRSARGLLALILLTDQFPRNMYRDTPQAFAFDELARGWCKQGMAAGLDLELPPIQRAFFYLPLEHSELLEDQRLSVQQFEKLAALDSTSNGQTFTGYAGFARRHYVIIERFGRFPHRNRILDRRSTAEETAFLQEKGSSF